MGLQTQGRGESRLKSKEETMGSGGNSPHHGELGMYAYPNSVPKYPNSE